MVISRLVLVVLPITLVACMPERARSKFAAEAFCPTERVEIETKYVDKGPWQPPADVAADPARLAMWGRTSHTMEKRYVASGCGQLRTYQCFKFGCFEEH
jgi:hypothetical protein